jgi:hypothetical protein
LHEHFAQGWRIARLSDQIKKKRLYGMTTNGKDKDHQKAIKRIAIRPEDRRILNRFYANSLAKGNKQWQGVDLSLKVTIDEEKRLQEKAKKEESIWNEFARRLGRIK